MDKTAYGANIEIISGFPIQNILEMKIFHQIKNHSELFLQVVICDGNFVHPESLSEMDLTVLDKHNPTIPLFTGKINSIEIHQENHYMTASIMAFSHSFRLDQEQKYQSFQNQELVFEDIVTTVLSDSNARFIWKVTEQKAIARPYLQYKETDWQFLSRLASHFHTVLQVSCTSDKPDFYFGLNQGEIQILDEKDVYEYGLSKKYYEEGHLGSHDWLRYQYIKINGKKRWQIGDYTVFKGEQFFVYQEQIYFERGALYFKYVLGTSGILYQKTEYNYRLKGLKIPGTIKNVENDNVFLQFGFDQQERADYPWPWVPEISNLGYFMPEQEQQAVLMFPDEDEKNGLAVSILRPAAKAAGFNQPSNRELSTIYDKTLSLYPDKVALTGTGGKPSLSLEDKNGILMDSDGDIRLSAQQEIVMKADKIQIQALQRIALQTAASNIELCQDINIYAPKGVTRKGTDTKPIGKGTGNGNDKITEQEHWQLTYGAMGAVTGLELSSAKPDSVLNLVTCGAVPKLGRGNAVTAMSQVQTGQKTTETSFPKVFSTMGNYMVKGGRKIPNEELK